MLRSIVHLDADAFFASVEQAADPRLRGKPVAVGGEKRGIIAAASYEARRFGIYTPMPTVRARKLCPQLILLPGDFEKYERFSRWMFSYAYDFTPDVEIGSIDEGYFDLSGTRKSPVTIAQTIRHAIRQALKITVSEGIGSNKLVSQIASKLNKPAAFFYVPTGREVTFLHPLPNVWLPGVGPQTAARLNTAGLAYVRQIAATPTDLLSLLVGNTAPQLKNFANAIDERPVVPVSEPAKSYGQQETFAQDQTNEEFIEATLRRMADHLMAKVRADGKAIRTLTVKVRYNDMDEHQASESLREPTDLETDIYSRLQALLRRAWERRVSLRMVSLKLANVYTGFFRTELPLEAEARQHEARRRLAATIDELRHTHGQKVILRGHDLMLAANETRRSPAKPKAVQRYQVTVVYKPRNSGRESALVLREESRSRLTPPPVQGNALDVPAVAGPGRSSSSKTSAVAFVPLAVRSYYSFLNSTLSPKAIVELAKRHELPAIALCDQGNLHGAVEFVQEARRAGIKPILGTEILWAGRPLRLYVQNARGYTNLCRLLSQIGVKATAPQNRLGKSSQGGRGKLGVPPSGGLGTVPPEGGTPNGNVQTGAHDFNRLLANAGTEGLLAVSADPRVAEFFPGRCYRDVGSPAELRGLAADPRLPAVACLPVHYATPADRWKYDVMQSIRTLTLLRQEHPGKDFTSDLRFHSPAELRELFREHPELLAPSQELVERCTFELPFGLPQFPPFAPPDGFTSAAFLRKLVMEGLARRYPAAQVSRLQPQVEQELAIIADVGYEEYFLMVWDILQTCREHGIEWITRGSAADSLVCYCLGISDVCPIRFGLYFRRFLNKERMALNKLPDIDVDFPHDRKDDVVDLVFAKHGPDYCAVVGGFSTFKARSAFAEVAKVLGVAEREVRRFTDRFPWSFPKPEGTGQNAEPKLERTAPADSTSAFSLQPSALNCLAATLRASPDCRDLPVDEEPYRSALLMAEFLDGFPRYPKMHPCGLVLSRQPMHELTPTFVSSKGYSTTHFDMDAVEAIGLVKMDILAQGGLSAMRDVKEMLAARGVKVDVTRCRVETQLPRSSRREEAQISSKGRVAHDKNEPPHVGGYGLFSLQPAALPLEDPAVWEMIAGGNARAVHHIESPAMISLCRMCQVHDIDTLIAIVSVIRPGAANEDRKREFTRRYQGLSPITYPHPSLEACLRDSYGLLIYEEQLLQICEAFAGLPAGRADVLRRALGKEKLDVVAEVARDFVACARARHRTDAEIQRVWELVSGFLGYTFCKAHSTAYGVEAYQSAWLKRYFPAEFMAAVLTNGKGFYRPLVYVLECHRLGMGLLPPWVNEPGPGFKPELASGPGATGMANSEASPPVKIRVPVSYVKGLTEATKERILAERQRSAYASLADFYRRVTPLPEEMEGLIRVGALDGFGQSRTRQYWDFRFLLHSFGESREPGQGWLLPPVGVERLPEVPLNEPTRRQRLEWEDELLGFPASGHPLELYEHIAWETYCPVNCLREFVGEEVVTCGLVIEDRVHHQVTGEPMKFLTLADWTGMIETELFAQTYKSYGLATVRYPVLEVTARVEPFENGRGFTLRVLRAGKPRERKHG